VWVSASTSPTGDTSEALPSGAVEAVVANAVTNVALAGLGFVTGTISARVLGPVGRGELAAIQIWPSFISCFAFLGLSEALLYFCAVTPKDSRQYTISAGVVALVSAVAAASLAYFLLPVLMQHQPWRLVGAARQYLLILPVLAILAAVSPPLRATGRFALWNVFRAAPQFLWLAVIVWAVLTGSTTARPMAWGYAVSLGIAAVPLAVVSLAVSPGHASFDSRSLVPLLRYGLSSVGGSISQALNLRMDQMLIAALLPSRELGLYVAAVAWSTLAIPMTSALAFVVVPVIAANHRDGSVRFALLSRLGAALSFAAVLALLPFTQFGIRTLFGRPFAEATFCALILVVASGFSGFNLVTAEVLKGVKRPGPGTLAELIGLAVTIVGLIIVLPRFGFIGAAWVSLVSYAATSIALIAFSARIATVGIGDLLILKRRDAAALMEIVSAVIGRYRSS
jgi:O-antigen/teichoic acid export membrane protein